MPVAVDGRVSGQCRVDGKEGSTKRWGIRSCDYFYGLKYSSVKHNVDPRISRDHSPVRISRQTTLEPGIQAPEGGDTVGQQPGNELSRLPGTSYRREGRTGQVTGTCCEL